MCWPSLSRGHTWTILTGTLSITDKSPTTLVLVVLAGMSSENRASGERNNDFRPHDVLVVLPWSRITRAFGRRSLLKIDAKRFIHINVAKISRLQLWRECKQSLY